MGTSVSSSGPGSGVPFVPPWVIDPDAADSASPVSGPDDASASPVSDPDVAAPASPVSDPDTATPPTSLADYQDVAQEVGDDANRPQQIPTQIAPPGRFRGARINMGRFARSGSGDSMKRGLGHYVRTGLGGAHRASHRMAGTARRAGALYGVLNALSSGTAPPVDLGIDTARLAGGSAREIVDRIAEALSPSDGTQDSEASRRSISQTLCELIRREPTADLTALTQEQIELGMELFISADIYRRMELDVGQTVFDRAPDPATAIRRLGEMERYARQAVAASFRSRTANSGSFTQQAATRLASRVIQDTFEIFESYLS